jgi:subtilisin family serine protease
MERRIVLIRSHEPLTEGWQKRSFGIAGAFLERQVHVAGLTFDNTYHPVQVVSRAAPMDLPVTAKGYRYGRTGKTDTFALRTVFDDVEAIERFKADRRTEVVGVFADPTITAFPTSYCGARAVGSTPDVKKALSVTTLRRFGLTGKNVRVAVVDTGIDGRQIPVAGGWAPDPGYVPGSTPPDHGTMVAYDVRITAPDAEIFDFALLRSQAGTWTGFLSDAIAAFAELMAYLERDKKPLVVNNSWGIFDRSEDAPISSPENYSANPNHPFNKMVGTLVEAGADVFFAAGNCGQQCPDGRCGQGDVGPGASIHGANSHPDVITVAAITVDHRRLGYSSQGPGGLHNRKPDVAAYSHFKGSGVYAVDGGTSAASPVAAGVAAAFRQKLTRQKVAPSGLKGLIQRTALDLEGDGWDYDLGYGVIDVASMIKASGLKARRTRKKKKAPKKKAPRKPKR